MHPRCIREWIELISSQCSETKAVNRDDNRTKVLFIFLQLATMKAFRVMRAWETRRASSGLTNQSLLISLSGNVSTVRVRVI